MKADMPREAMISHLVLLEYFPLRLPYLGIAHPSGAYHFLSGVIDPALGRLVTVRGVCKGTEQDRAEPWSEITDDMLVAFMADLGLMERE
ncbi:hypothetical protein [Burkholderia anthina]|uniref:hypothetical protein n=1 Tax=Burkholderia anthina TaxID=179879 RepID=UPI0037C0FF8F